MASDASSLNANELINDLIMARWEEEGILLGGIKEFKKKELQKGVPESRGILLISNKIAYFIIRTICPKTIFLHIVKLYFNFNWRELALVNSSNIFCLYTCNGLFNNYKKS